MSARLYIGAVLRPDIAVLYICNMMHQCGSGRSLGPDAIVSIASVDIYHFA
jgi:hypothetical protein